MKISNRLAVGEKISVPDEDHVRVLEGLYEVIDPELGVNIVDLGLVYSLEIADKAVSIDMTMTTPACPLHAYLSEQVELAVRQVLPSARSVDVHLVWSPPWDPSMMSNAAREQFGW